MTNQEIIGIEDLGNENGYRYWDAREVSDFLGYASYKSFKNVINRAIQSATHVGADIADEFGPYHTEDGFSSYRLTRFALLLCVQNADRTKERVNKAQTYLSAFANAKFEENLSRLDARAELTNNEKAMTTAAVNAGLNNDSKSIAYFKDFGYRGLYNMTLKELKRHKGFDKSGPMYDYMNSTELAANSLRVALTKDTLDSGSNMSERQILDIAQNVGKDVRDLVIRNSRIKPEDIKLSDEKINKIKTNLKKESKQINKEFDKL